MKKMKRKTRKILASVLSMLLLFAMSTTAFAAESVSVPAEATAVATRQAPEVALPASVEGRSIYGYAADYTDDDAGRFTVNAPGSATSTGHATIKTSDFSSSSVIIYVSIYRPDGTLAKSNVRLTGNQETVVSFSNAQPGNYTVSYAVTGTVQGWVHCWIY